ncbi:7948_t:CDS:2 [Gigaspora margarita]|uniref:7948_t:CDS:1 n=2 Tax=Gigaspora margarita TaxID=4874 RepID=A0ABN7V5K9_GIGMA|nr:RraA-like protein [Gigaspora margarita]CAG8734091.1 7948_t:CDS:2 [Gigaspora margarita]
MSERILEGNLEEKLKHLETFSSCDVADALLKIDNPYGGFLPDIVMFSPDYLAGNSKLIGPVFTVKCVPVSDVNSPKPSQHFADAVPANSVVFVSAPPDTINAVWGGLMNTRAKIRGAKGVVVDGRVRDLEELRADGLPVFAKAISVLSAKAFTRPTSFNEPVFLNGNYEPQIKINPGDIIIADLNGVVCIPQKDLDRVLELCDKYVAMDQKVKEELLKGTTIQQSFALHRK